MVLLRLTIWWWLVVVEEGKVLQMLIMAVAVALEDFSPVADYP
jgi:hypothetical protein